MLIVDERTRLPVGDPDEPIVDPAFAARAADAIAEAVREAVDRMILSASGWRTVFAADGREESTTRDVPPELLVAAGAAARCFADTLVRKGDGRARVALALDTRPTGPVVARAAIRTLLGAGVDVNYPFVCASPEVMAYAATTPEIDGFFYVSASHNPVGHNGLKMGGRDGGVAGGDDASALIDAFRALIAEPDELVAIAAELARPADDAERAVFAAIPEAKRDSLARYSSFCTRVIAGDGPRAARAFERLRAGVAAARPGVVGDLNGSARAATIDRDYLATTGCRLSLINDRPGEIAHQIVPEGAGLAACRAELDRLAHEDPSWGLGYVPDNDGDRGNLVYYDRRAAHARQLEAQEVFALSTAAELAWLVFTGELAYHVDGRPSRRVAVVVNGPTSLRIDRIARLFGAEVHRAEVGEANVVARARELRGEGVLVRMLGEGSNGGTITHPSAVRDPLHTIHAVLKLLYTETSAGSPSPLDIWIDRCGLPATGLERNDLAALVATLPRFTTTSAFEERAIMRIRSDSHAELKREAERLLPDEADAIIASLPDDLGVTTYRVVNYERTTVRPGPGNRTGAERGGLKIELADATGLARAFLWMRGSGTEPVFRVMADVEGERPDVETALLARLRDLVARADRAATAA
ncbi:MAG: phosphatidylglycerol lysyltransferase [Spirochaetota bacterium]